MIRSWPCVPLLALFLACDSAPTEPESDGGVELELTPEQRATLEAADIHDGSADKIVGECGRCALAMPGDEAHAVHAGEYELHFCSDSCKAAFEADPEKGITEMQGFLDADQ
jgi:hypothetical protein